MTVADNPSPSLGDGKGGFLRLSAGAQRADTPGDTPSLNATWVLIGNIILLLTP
jgi:hypothetical protein